MSEIRSILLKSIVLVNELILMGVENFKLMKRERPIKGILV